MSGSDYRYKINSICLKNDNSFNPSRINIFVGANNCGKTQLLKDILASITGKKKSTVILDKIDIPYPQNWDEVETAYNMKIIEVDQYQALQHISPTLDTPPILGIRSLDVRHDLNNWIQLDNDMFFSAIGPGLVTYLNTDNRLRLAMSQPAQPNLQERGPQNLLETLYTSGSRATQTVRKYIKAIFGTDIYLNAFNVGTLQINVGEDFSSIDSDPQQVFKQLQSYPLLDTQGDGIRSAVGIISAIISVEKPIILLDEPEAFMHPPQALQFGSIISDLVDATQQIFIATHSADFLRGLLSSVKDVSIIHFNRTKNITKAKVLDSETLKQIITDPLLSSSRVLEGMFYKSVVATEADADSVFYQRLFQQVGSADEVHFVNAHNKQTLKKIIAPYQKLGIKFAMIADADVIRDKHEFSEILQVTSNQRLKEQILLKREKILNFFQCQDKCTSLLELQGKIKELAEQPLDLDNATPDVICRTLSDFRASLKKLREDADKLSEFKKRGRSALPSELQTDFDEFFQLCADIGFFIVPVGELESWMIDYGLERTSNKSKWISQALSKQFDIKYDKTKDIWKFVDALRTFLAG